MPRPLVAFPTDLEQEGQHFASGVNNPGEIRGFLMSARHVGITFTTARPAVLAELEKFAGPGSLSRVFWDTGAFSEVEFDKKLGRLVVVKPIKDDQWNARFDQAEKIAGWFGPRAYITGPDLVGDQDATLARLAKWAHRVAAVAALRAQIIVPVQKGALPMSEMFRRSCEILGLAETPIAGIPMKKDATSLADLAELVSSMPWYGCRFHLLGMGPRAKKGAYAKAIRCIKSLRPNAVITSDSAMVCGMVGRGGKKALAKANAAGKPAPTPRVLTRYQDEARAKGMTGPDVKAYGLSKQGEDEYQAHLDRAHAAGWFDTELYDTLEEARADRAAGYPEPARTPTATAPASTPRRRAAVHQLALGLA